MYQDILNFWFDELELKMWFTKDDALDNTIRKRFTPHHTQAHKGELYTWRNAPHSALAEIIILDQFSRNMYRDTPAAFASDPVALTLAQTAIEKGFDTRLADTQRGFLYMPFMHSESASIHQIAVELFAALGNGGSLEYELKHKAIIDKFGRYPHRNAILGRKSTAEELEFLQQPDSGF